MYAATGSAAALTSSIASILMPKQTGSCVSGAANLISTAINLAWFLRMKDESATTYYETTTSIVALSSLSIMDLTNCAAPNALKENATTFGLEISTTLLALAFLMDVFTGQWTDAFEVAMQLLSSNFKLFRKLLVY